MRPASWSQDGTRPVPAAPAQRADQADEAARLWPDYRYAHDEADGYAAGENYFPEGMPRTRFYEPVARGLELRIGERLAELRALNAAAGKKG